MVMTSERGLDASDKGRGFQAWSPWDDAEMGLEPLASVARLDDAEMGLEPLWIDWEAL